MNTAPRHRLLELAAESSRDWLRAARMSRLWTALGFEDLIERYRRTFFGVTWLVVSFAVFILVYMLVFGHGSGLSTADYALYVTIGFGAWNFMASIVGESCTSYTSSGNWIQGTSIPYPVFILQTLYRNWLVFLLTIAVVIVAMLWLEDHWNAGMLWALPGLLVYVITPLWLIAILAPLCARWHDLHHAVQTGMRLLFFATPILWIPAQRAQLQLLAYWNPLTYFIDIVRAPLLGDGLPVQSWIVVGVVNAIGLVAGWVTYTLTRHRVVFWL
jgi:ABC-type polysaccharide/polyol phosphate export permease